MSAAAAAAAAVAEPAADMPASVMSTPHDTPGYNTPTPETAAAAARDPWAAEVSPGEAALRKSVIDKWLNPEGPPKGSTFGARKLKDDDDVFSKNAWWVLVGSGGKTAKYSC